MHYINFLKISPTSSDFSEIEGNMTENICIWGSRLIDIRFKGVNTCTYETYP